VPGRAVDVDHLAEQAIAPDRVVVAAVRLADLVAELVQVVEVPRRGRGVAGAGGPVKHERVADYALAAVVLRYGDVGDEQGHYFASSMRSRRSRSALKAWSGSGLRSDGPPLARG